MNKKIPIKAVKEFAEKYNKDQVIIISYSNTDNKTWVTTYGKTEIDCDQAYQAGRWFMEDFEQPQVKIEPHRVKKLKAEIKALKTENQKLKNELI